MGQPVGEVRGWDRDAGAALDEAGLFGLLQEAAAAIGSGQRPRRNRAREREQRIGVDAEFSAHGGGDHACWSAVVSRWHRVVGSISPARGNEHRLTVIVDGLGVGVGEVASRIVGDVDLERDAPRAERDRKQPGRGEAVAVSVAVDPDERRGR